MAPDIPTWPKYRTKTMVDWVVYDDDGQTLYSSKDLPRAHTLVVAETITDAGSVHLAIPVLPGQDQEARVREALARKGLNAPPSTG